MNTHYSNKVSNAVRFIRLWEEYENLSNLNFPESVKPGLHRNKEFFWEIVFGNSDDDSYCPSTIDQFVQLAKVYKRIEKPCVNLSELNTINYKVLEWYIPHSHIN